MYTQCPECRISFRVTAKVLQKAAGRVRCGGCGLAFNAINHLSEEPPDTDDNPSDPLARQPDAMEASERSATLERLERLHLSEPIEQEDDFDERSQALLKTLDELAGPDNVRIEDTGVEWRVLDESEMPDDPPPEEPPDEPRYDDNTPLPEDYDDDEDDPFEPEQAEPQEIVTDQDEDEIEFDTRQVDLALGEDSDWTGLLDIEDDRASEDSIEVAEPISTEEPAKDDPEELGQLELEEIEEVAAAQPDEISDSTDSAESDEIAQRLEAAQAHQFAEDSAILPQLAAELDDEPDDLDTQFNLQAEALGLDITRNTVLDSPDDDVESADAPAVEDDVTEPEALDEPDPVGSHDEDSDEGELSAEEEALIVEKLRESTGAFQKQIKAAQLALDKGETDEYTERDSESTDEPEESDSLQPSEDGAGEESVDDMASAPEDESTQTPNDEIALAAAANSRDDDILSQSMIQAGFDPSVLSDENIEAIVMEGDIVSHSLDNDTANEELIADLDTQGSFIDTYILNKGKVRGALRNSGPVSVGAIAAVVILALMLGGQYLHASRQTFATFGAFDQTVGPVYRALGQPVTPLWNIKGWQFESTRGNTDENDEVLTVFSKIRNTSDKPLPYPLVHISLTDRWEEIIGSNILEPIEYLAGDVDPQKMVAPGDSLTAVIAIEGHSQDATGFQLYVCYRVGPGRVRCATEDFKN